MGHKQRHTMQYTEVVYYDDGGDEAGRERLHDDHTYDIGPEEDLTVEEREDWLG